MAKVFVPLAEGFEDIEAFTVVDVLRRAGVKVDIIGVPSSQVTSAHGVRIFVDKKITDVNSDEYDGVILPGGNPGYINLGKSSILLEMVKSLNKRGKLVGAICGAPIILAKAGVLNGKRATVYPGMETELPYPRDDKVVVDGNVVTSQAAGTAMEFALKLVEVLAGSSKAEKLRKDLVV